MEFLFLALILVTAPLFWIIGVVSFFKSLFGKKTQTNSSEQRQKLLLEILPELKKAAKDKKHLDYLIKTYSLEVPNFRLEEAIAASEVSTKALKPVPTPPAGEVGLEQNITNWWENWYEENTINFFLYLGAFLIVSAAAIFVGLSWESLSGTTKSLFLDGLTLVFFASGLYFYFLTPKLRNGGATFIGISAILLPFNGLAWYNFVIGPAGGSFSNVWLATSIISFFFYVAMAGLIRNKLYTYIASLGGLSIIESLVAVGSLPTDYYILGGILSAFAFALSSQLFSQGNQDSKETYADPLYLSAQVTMPIALAFGLVFAASNGKLFTMTSSLASVLAAGFYLFTYYLKKEATFLGLAQLLGSLTIWIGAKAANLDNVTTFYLIQASAYVHLGIGLAFNSLKKTGEEKQSYGISLFVGLGALLLSIFNFIPAEHLTIQAALTSILFLVCSFSLATPGLLNGFWLVLGYGLFTWYTQVLGLGDQLYYFSLILSACAAGFFATAALFWKERKAWAEALLLGTGVYLIFAHVFAFDKLNVLLVINATTASICLAGSYFFSEKSLVYTANAFMYFSLWTLLRIFNVQIEFYPFWFSLGAASFYLASYLPLGVVYETASRWTGLISLGVFPLLFWHLWASNYYFSSVGLLERNALITAWVATAIYIFDALVNKSYKVRYLASAAFLVSILWQEYYLGIRYFQAYAVPAGIYFLAISYFQNKTDKKDIFDTLGLLILFGSTLIQSLGANGAIYSLEMGLEGVVLLALGTSLKYRNYTYAGIGAIVLAVLVRTLFLISEIPTWVTIGGGGLIFLIVAFYLLSTKKQK